MLTCWSVRVLIVPSLSGTSLSNKSYRMSLSTEAWLFHAQLRGGFQILLALRSLGDEDRWWCGLVQTNLSKIASQPLIVKSEDSRQTYARWGATHDSMIESLWVTLMEASQFLWRVGAVYLWWHSTTSRHDCWYYYELSVDCTLAFSSCRTKELLRLTQQKLRLATSVLTYS